MAGRNDAALAAALQAMAQAVQNNPGAAENAGTRSLATFQRENPPTFKGRYNPDGALAWLKEMERIFRVMDCTEAQKVRYGTHMLAEEADDWWLEARQRLETANEEITWNVFKREFTRKYYPEDVRGKKEIEFLELKQGSMSVTEYAAKFTELAKFYPHYAEATAEFSKCIKFENGLRADIKKAIGYQKIRVFADLIDSCRIFEEDSNAHYRVMKNNRNSAQNRGKPYETPVGKGEQKAVVGAKRSGGDAAASVVCYKCGKTGHKRPDCPGDVARCFKCGKEGHMASNCDRKGMLCFNCGEEGHISTQCTKPKKERTGGRVFALAGSDAVNEIRGTCFINSTPLIAIVDTGASHCFIAAACVDKLGLSLSDMLREMVIDTPAKGSVTTSLICAKCPLSIFGKDFFVDLICLPLSGMDVILGMNWLVDNYVHINCRKGSVSFSSPEEEVVWLGAAGESMTWELESKMRESCPELFESGMISRTKYSKWGRVVTPQK